MKKINELLEIRNKVKLAIGKHNGKLYWTHSKVVENGLLNKNNGFHLWLDNKISRLIYQNKNYHNEVNKLEKSLKNYFQH